MRGNIKMKKKLAALILVTLCFCSCNSTNQNTETTMATINAENLTTTIQTTENNSTASQKVSTTATTTATTEPAISKEYDSETSIADDDVNPGMSGKFYIVFNGKKYYPALYRTLFVKNGNEYFEYTGDWHNIPPDNFIGLLREAPLLNDAINHYQPKGNLKFCSAPQNDFETNISEFDGGTIYTFSESQDLIPINNTIMILTSSSPLYSVNDTDFFLYTEVHIQI